MSTFFDFKKALTNCTTLPGVESIPLVLMLYILAFSDQFGGPSGHDFISASSWSNFPSMLAGEAVWDRSLTFGGVVFALYLASSKVSKDRAILWTCLEL